jgi:hypothetical protein
MQNAAFETAAINAALRRNRERKENDNNGEEKNAAETLQICRNFLRVT